jgi:plastocyanin domain-containing protein
MRAGAVLITAMGLTMFSNGWNLGGFASPADFFAAKFGARQSQGESAVFEPVIQNGAQIINSTLLPGRYPAITVQEGIPVRWTINAPQGSINGCNNRMLIREYGIEHSFKTGDNVIEFTPSRAGRFSYSCWMGMIRSSITVAAEGGQVLSAQEPDRAPKPAGVVIPADSVALAQVSGGFQKAVITLNDDGIAPAVIVVQRGVRALWTITNDSLDPGNNALVFPAYYQKIDMAQGDNTIEFLPDADFAFSTADSVFYGYVKVVDDITKVDIDAVKKEVSEFETLIYPDAYFEAGIGAGSCCS